MTELKHSAEIMQFVTVKLDFNDFWAHWPRKVAKKKAREAYFKAVKLASHDEIVAGVEEYIRNKPGYQDYAHAATWLTGERWTDEWETEITGFENI